MHRRAFPVLSAAVAAGVAITLAGCGAASEEPSSTASTDPEPTDVATTPSASPAASTAPGPEPDAASAWENETDPETRLAGCLAGEWDLDRDVWIDGMRSVMEADLSAVEVDNSGSIVLVIDPAGDYTVNADQFTTVSTGQSPGGDMHWTMLFDGVEPGTWTVAGEELTLATAEGDRIEAQHELTMDGELLPAEMLATDGSPWSETLAISCDASLFTAIPVDEPDGVEIAFQRIS